MATRSLAKILIAGTGSFAVALLVTLAVTRRVGQSDPGMRADRLISRCESKISEIESSLAHIKAAVESPA